jgi:hypothetical protein
MNGSLTLIEHPNYMVRLSYEHCARAGQYCKPNLISQIGPAFRLREIAQRSRHTDASRCMVRVEYPTSG